MAAPDGVEISEGSKCSGVPSDARRLYAAAEPPVGELPDTPRGADVQLRLNHLGARADGATLPWPIVVPLR